MNTFKINYIITGCCSHFSIHTVFAVSLVAHSKRAVLQLALHPLQSRMSRAVPPTRQRAPKPVVYRRHTLPRHAPVRSPTLSGILRVRLLVVTLADVRRDPPTLSRSRAAVLSAPSTGARLRRALPISPFQAWRHVPFRYTDRSGHAGSIDRD